MKSETWDVNGVRYRVVLVDGLEDHGECDREKGLIQISADLAPSPRAAVRRHELAHAAWWESGAHHRHFRDYGENIADQIEEDVMERFIPVHHNIRRIK